MPNAITQPQAGELTVAQLAELTGLPVRTVRYRVQRWHERGFPRVRRVSGQRGDASGVYLVRADDYNAWRAGATAPTENAA